MKLDDINDRRIRLSQLVLEGIETAAGVYLPAPTAEVAAFRQWRAEQLVRIYCAVRATE